MPADYYGVLGLAPSATADEIKRSYKKLAVKFHPDKTNDPSLHNKFLLINEAYETLKDDALRKTYDLKNGISSLSSSSKSDPFHRDGFRSHHGFSYFLSTRNGPGSYFNWQQLNFRAYEDAYYRHSRQEKEDVAAAATAAAAQAAKLAQKQMEAEMKRRQDEYMEKARQQREREQLEELDRKMRKQKEAKEREERERRKQQTEELEEMYRGVKQRAFQRLWHGVNGYDNSSEQPGTNSSEPIIVEDEVGSDSDTDDAGDFHDANIGDESVDLDADDGWTEEIHDVEVESEIIEDSGISDAASGLDESHNGVHDWQSRPPTAEEPDQSFNQDHDGSDANVTDASLKGAPETPNDGPEVVEIPEDGDIDGLSGIFSHEEPKSPQRKPLYSMTSPQAKVKTQKFLNEQRRREASFQHGPTSAKKPRFADMSDLRDTLGTDLDDVSFDDMRDNLPETGPKTRKASGSVQSPFKRARTEYTDGTSRAQTLFTPINKLSARFTNSTISPSDLTPDVDENSIMFTATPPQIDIGLSLTHKQWDEYVQNINNYERKFAEYRKAVLQYQIGRLEKDERHRNIIYSDTSCVEAYLSCLFNDMLIIQNYHRTLLEFRETLKTFKRNCDEVNAMQTLGNV